MTAPLVYPVGHYVGAHHPAVGAPLQYRKIRLGAEVVRLPDEDHLRVWALSHGLPEHVGQVRWSRQAVLDAAGDVPEAEGVLDRLIAMGLVVEVIPGTPAAGDFARTHRMRPLLTGLGNSPADPLWFAIGPIGTPVVKVDSFVFEMWQWGRLGDSLWDTAEMFSRVDRTMSERDGSDQPAVGGGVLADILERLHQLLAYNATYLDLRLTRPPGDDPFTDPAERVV